VDVKKRNEIDNQHYNNLDVEILLGQSFGCPHRLSWATAVGACDCWNQRFDPYPSIPAISGPRKATGISFYLISGPLPGHILSPFTTKTYHDPKHKSHIILSVLEVSPLGPDSLTIAIAIIVYHRQQSHRLNRFDHFTTTAAIIIVCY
jgi:hypothetical protein